jgi:cell division protein FtsB
MEDIRSYRIDEEETRRATSEEERYELNASADDEVPFHIPRD